VQKEFYFDRKPQSDQWDCMWTSRTIEQELAACDIESPPRELFLSYLRREDRIIDAGCGFGKWVIYLKKLGYDIMGIDNNHLAIDKLREYDRTLKIELGDVQNIHHPDNSFDAYISMGVVEHFEDGPISALKEAYRVLKPNGLIFVSVPTVNVVRRIIRRSIRNAINTLPVSFIALRSDWGKSKRGALLDVAGILVNILPIITKKILVKVGIYYHFAEFRYSKSELENFLKQTGFDVIKTVPHDFYGSKDHAVGLVVDFPFLGAPNRVNFQLNSVGKAVSRIFNAVSPWITCSSVLCVAKSMKESR
jgi:SAM-dependent methyltransferase